MGSQSVVLFIFIACAICSVYVCVFMYSTGAILTSFTFESYCQNLVIQLIFTGQSK
jgi:hypothetical protein